MGKTQHNKCMPISFHPGNPLGQTLYFPAVKCKVKNVCCFFTLRYCASGPSKARSLQHYQGSTSFHCQNFRHASGKTGRICIELRRII